MHRGCLVIAQTPQCLLLGFFFMGLGSMFLPMVILVPQKFAFCFTLGSLLFMASFAALKGPGAYCKSIMQPDVLPRTVAYFSSMALTIYAAMIARSYILVVIASSIQVGRWIDLLCALPSL